MEHEPKLSAYIIQLKREDRSVENSNRNLFRHIIGDTSSPNLDDSYIFLEMCRKFISKIDTATMFSDDKSKRCMTANQINIESVDVNTNIRFHSDKFVIEGVIEGGRYGKKKKKTLTTNKNIKSDVSEDDAITDDFYFFLYTPPISKKSILLIQSYSDDSIDSVMKKFWKNFYSFPQVFKEPTLSKFVPPSIINDFKHKATISNIVYTTEVPSETLLQDSTSFEGQSFKVTIKIEPSKDGKVLMKEFDDIVIPIQNSRFRGLRLNSFRRKKGLLKDIQTGKTTPFELNNDFEIKPVIHLSKYIEIQENESDFERIKEYCFAIIEEIKKEIYIENAVQER